MPQRNRRYEAASLNRRCPPKWTQKTRSDVLTSIASATDATDFITEFAAIINDHRRVLPGAYVSLLEFAPYLDPTDLLRWLDKQIRDGTVSYTTRLSEAGAGWGTAAPTTLANADPLDLVTTLESLGCNVLVCDAQAVDDGDAGSTDGPVQVEYDTSTLKCYLINAAIGGGATAKTTASLINTTPTPDVYRYKLLGGPAGSAASKCIDNMREGAHATDIRYPDASTPCIVLWRAGTDYEYSGQVLSATTGTQCNYILWRGYPGETPVMRLSCPAATSMNGVLLNGSSGTYYRKNMWYDSLRVYGRTGTSGDYTFANRIWQDNSSATGMRVLRCECSNIQAIEPTAGAIANRASDSAADVDVSGTLDHHHIPDGATVDVEWVGGSRTGMTVGTTTATTIPVSGGTGTALPADTTAVTVVNTAAYWASYVDQDYVAKDATGSYAPTFIRSQGKGLLVHASHFTLAGTDLVSVGLTEVGHAIDLLASAGLTGTSWSDRAATISRSLFDGQAGHGQIRIQNRVQYVLIEDCDISNADNTCITGFSDSIANQAGFVWIRRNRIHDWGTLAGIDNDGHGIQLFSLSDCIVEDNVIFQNETEYHTSAHDGVSLQHVSAGDSADGDTKRNVVRNNVIYKVGVVLRYNSGTTASGDDEIADNEVYDNVIVDFDESQKASALSDGPVYIFMYDAITQDLYGNLVYDNVIAYDTTYDDTDPIAVVRTDGSTSYDVAEDGTYSGGATPGFSGNVVLNPGFTDADNGDFRMSNATAASKVTADCPLQATPTWNS